MTKIIFLLIIKPITIIMMIRITMTTTMMMMIIRMIIILIRIMMTDYEDTTTATTNNNNNNSCCCCCCYNYSTDTESRNSKYFTISSTCNENCRCLQHVCLCDHGAIARKSRAVYQTHITCNMSCATWYEGTTQLLPFGIVEISFIVGLFHWLFNR